ncbi:hypothetical protein GQX74_012773 [Glossina fuscipes]|nr:hypothetical protein GQX74_012773 [Glossina fuscipes]
MVSTMFMIFFETKWIITLFLELLFANDNYSVCLECWSFCRFFGSWRLAFPYILIGIALMMWPHNLWLSYVAGILMILLALLRLCLIFRFTNNFKDEELLPQSDFDKIESDSNRRDDGFVEIVPSLEEEEPIDDVC